MYSYRSYLAGINPTDPLDASSNGLQMIGTPNGKFPHFLRLHHYELHISMNPAAGAKQFSPALCWVDSGTAGGFVDWIESDTISHTFDGANYVDFDFSHDYGDEGKAIYRPLQAGLGQVGLGIIDRSGNAAGVYGSANSYFTLQYSLDLDYRQLPVIPIQ